MLIAFHLKGASPTIYKFRVWGFRFSAAFALNQTLNSNRFTGRDAFVRRRLASMSHMIMLYCMFSCPKHEALKLQTLLYLQARRRSVNYLQSLNSDLK